MNNLVNCKGCGFDFEAYDISFVTEDGAPFCAKCHEKRMPQEALATPYPSANEFGLTKREYFAAKAMQALVPKYEMGVMYESCIAKQAVRFADELIAALSRDKTSGGGDA